VARTRRNACFDKACADANTVIVFDLSELTYCDSSGIRALLQASARCAKDGPDMQVVGAHGLVRRVIDLTHTADALNLIDAE
jgi:anti-sigma B factor antagonist